MLTFEFQCLSHYKPLPHGKQNTWAYIMHPRAKHLGISRCLYIMCKYIIAFCPVISFDALQSYIDGVTDFPSYGADEIKEYELFVTMIHSISLP